MNVRHCFHALQPHPDYFLVNVFDIEDIGYADSPRPGFTNNLNKIVPMGDDFFSFQDNPLPGKLAQDLSVSPAPLQLSASVA
jgi:hypothetical protein